MRIKHPIVSIRPLTAVYLLSLITIIDLTNTVKGIDVKTYGWSNAYNQHLYSDLTGTIRELTSTDDDDDTDTRFQPPLDTINPKVQPIDEGYRIARNDPLAPAISGTINKVSSHDRHKRDASADNSSTPTTASTPPTTSTASEQLSTTLSNITSDDDSILSDIDANAWAASLLLAPGFDGSGVTTDETTESTATSQLTSVSESTSSTEITINPSTITANETATQVSSSTTPQTSIVTTSSYGITEESTSTNIIQTIYTSVSSTSSQTTSVETGGEISTESTSEGTTSTTETLSTASNAVTVQASTIEQSTSSTQTVSEIVSSTSTINTETITSSAATLTEISSAALSSSTTTQQSTEQITETPSTLPLTSESVTTIVTNTETSSAASTQTNIQSSSVSTEVTQGVTETETSISTQTVIPTGVTESTTEISSVGTISVSTSSTSPVTTQVSSTTTISSIETVTTSQTTVTTSVTEQGTSTSTGSTATSTLTPIETTSFYLYFNHTASARRRRAIEISSPSPSTLENEIAKILLALNITCNDTCIQINQTNNVALPSVEYFVMLNVSLDVSQRIGLVNGFFDNNVTLNDSYVLTVRIVMNDAAPTPLSFTVKIAVCRECEFTERGNCTSDAASCVCYPNYDGLYCRNLVQITATTTTPYLPTSIGITTSTLSSTTQSSIQPSETLSVTSSTSSISTSMGSESSTVYSTVGTITIATSTVQTETASIITSTATETTFESSTSGTSFSTSSTATLTGTSFSTVELTSISSILTTATTSETETSQVTGSTSSSSAATFVTTVVTETMTASIITTATVSSVSTFPSSISTETTSASSTTTTFTAVETGTSTVTVSTSQATTATVVVTATSTIGIEYSTLTVSVTTTAASTASTTITTAETTVIGTATSSSSTTMTETTTTATGVSTSAAETTASIGITGTVSTTTLFSTSTPSETTTATTGSTSSSIATPTATTAETQTQAVTTSTNTGTTTTTGTTISIATTESTIPPVTTGISSSSTTATSSSTSVTSTNTITTESVTATRIASSTSTTTNAITTEAISSRSSTAIVATEITSSSSTVTTTITTASTLTSSTVSSIGPTVTVTTESTQRTEITSATTTINPSTLTTTVASTITSTSASITVPIVTTQASSSISTSTSSITTVTSTTEVFSSVTSAGSITSSSTITSEVPTSIVTSTSTSTIGVTQEIITSASSTLTSSTPTASSSITTTTAATGTQSITSVTTSSITQGTITSAASSIVTTTTITTSGSSTTSTVTATSQTSSPPSITSTVSVTEQTSAGVISTSTAISSSTTAQPIASTITSSIITVTVTTEASSSSTITGTTISSSTATSQTSSSPSITSAVGVTEQTSAGVTSTSTAISSSTTTQPIVSTITSSITTVTVATEASSSSTITGTISSSSTATSETSSSPSTTTTVSITEQTSAGVTSTSTAISSSTTTQPIVSTITSSITTVTVTTEASSSSTITGTIISSSTATSQIVTSTSSSTTGVSEQTITTISASTTSTATSAVTTQTGTSTVTSSIAGVESTGAISSVGTFTAATSSSSTQTSSVTTQIFSSSTSSTTGTAVTSEIPSTTVVTSVTFSSSSATPTVTIQTSSSTITTATTTGSITTEVFFTTVPTVTTTLPSSTVTSTISSTVTSTLSVTEQSTTSRVSTEATSSSSTITSTATSTAPIITSETSTSSVITSAVTSNTVSSPTTTTTTIQTSSSTSTMTSSGTEQTVTNGTVTSTVIVITSTSTSSITTGSTLGTITSAYITSTSTTQTTTTSTVAIATIPTATSTSISTTITTSITTVMITTATQAPSTNCTWSNWIAASNCTPSCGIGYRKEVRSCIKSGTTQTCSNIDCGDGGIAERNNSCPSLPPCETVTIIPLNSTRDPSVRIASYILPDTMYFFGETYSRIWIASKGYFTFDTPYYGQTMSSSVFGQLFNQALAAPFWANLNYDTSTSNITLNWFSSLNASQSDMQTYYRIIQRTINEACPAQYCSQNFAVIRAVRIDWNNLYYQQPNNQSTAVSFSAYLINTYEAGYYSYPILRSYLSFDYTGLTNNLGDLRPFVGYRGKYTTGPTLNDPTYNQNALFLRNSLYKSFYTGGRFLTQCEVNFLSETNIVTYFPSENLNDVVNNPRFPCPCTLNQARADRRFSPLYSETSYEQSQNVQCYGPLVTSWIRRGWYFILLRSQTCCYNQIYGGLITYGALAGSVLSYPYQLFQPYPWLRRITFHDQCCFPTYTTGSPDWNTCRFYYQLHPASTCTGYQPPTIVTGIGDPHINTIDNGRYTCHIQGVYVFARTTTNATLQASINENLDNISDVNFLYRDDLFYIHVRSDAIPPALPYVERTKGYASVFSSYVIGAGNFTFNISKNNGQFGFTAVNSSYSSNLTDILSTNLNYDDMNTRNPTERYIYRVKQTNVSLTNTTTIPQLTLSIWSGLTIQCQIVSENLECILLLPEKYRFNIEGLAGNFNGDYRDDLVNNLTKQNVLISAANDSTANVNDSTILSACRSWKVPTDTTPNILKPILPSDLLNWYDQSESILTGLNPNLNRSIVNQVCSSNYECRHDYIIRINPITSQATASSSNTIQQSRTTFAEQPPTISITSAIKIAIPFNDSNRNYILPISITGANNVTVSITGNNTAQTNTTFTGSSITIPIPSSNNTYVEVSLIITYGTNSTTVQYLDITTCLCVDSSNCDYDHTATISPHYQIASCNCLPQYDGTFCQEDYNGCKLASACKINWMTNTTCNQLNASEQVRQGHSYYCTGNCVNGYKPVDNYLCEDINECNNSTICGNGVCINTIGSYTCNCSTGYKFDSPRCVDINECIEPSFNGAYNTPCTAAEICTNTNGSFTCACDPLFNVNGTCIYNASLCTFPNSDTCIVSNTTVCLRGTINQNNTCIPWCQTSCPGFCEIVNGNYQCNCLKYPGYQLTDNGKSCSPCGSQNYGYGCNESCQCENGICNTNATNSNDSCTCFSNYLKPFCSQRLDLCASNNPCNNATEDCITDLESGNATCNCKSGYTKNLSNPICTDMDECDLKRDTCDRLVSQCVNTIGSYYCNCSSGYEKINDTCIDKNECRNSSICSVYNNTYCANVPGTYECRCVIGYSLGGDYTQPFGNAIGSTSQCLPTDFSPFCQNQCQPPASCSSKTGLCECPANYKLVVVALNQTLQTCQCPNHPYEYYNGTTCVNATGLAWLLLNFTEISSRVAAINPTGSTNLANDISAILSDMNITCNGSCINLYDTQDAVPPSLQIMITLNANLNATQRLALVNGIFNRSLTYNSSYSLAAVEMIINPASTIRIPFYGSTAACQECAYLQAGICTTDQTDCLCLTNYTGYFCRELSPPSTPALSSPLSTQWTIIVAVVSAVAGLLLIISIVMCIFYCVTRRRKSSSSASLKKTTVSRPQFTIPRAHVPTMGTVSRNLTSWDGPFSLDNTNDEQFVDASDSFPSSSTTTYNTTYRMNGNRTEADFGIFDELENRTPISRGHIPRPQMLDMLGTLNSLPTQEQFDDPSRASTFSDSHSLDDIELVTDMLEDMTKDDDIDDEFVEALNPNLAIPRLNTQSEDSSSGWLSFFRDS